MGTTQVEADKVCRVPHTRLPAAVIVDADLQAQYAKGTAENALIEQYGHSPVAFKLFQKLNRELTWHSAVETRTHEMARLRIARLNACHFCSNGRHTSRDGAQYVEEELVERVKEGNVDDDSLFTRREQLAVHLAEQLFDDPHGYPEQSWDALLEAFTSQEIIELGMQIVLNMGMGKMAAWLGIASPLVDQ